MIVAWTHLMLGLVIVSSQIAAPVQLGGPQNVGRSPHIPKVALPQLAYAPSPLVPPLAMLARVHGTVRLVAEIDETGAVVSATVQSGHPFLVPTALDAIRRHRYRPGTMNGVAAQFMLPIDLEFRAVFAPVEPVQLW